LLFFFLGQREQERLREMQLKEEQERARLQQQLNQKLLVERKGEASTPRREIETQSLPENEPTVDE
jgi:hypothetical protein